MEQKTLSIQDFAKNAEKRFKKVEDIKTIGIVIADDDEYAPLYKYVEKFGGKEFSFYERKGHEIELKTDGGFLRLRFILCGIGKVNAALAAGKLINDGCDAILNSGLSGGISGISRGELMVGTSFMEHDFDLRCFGYKLGEKPGQKFIYEGSKKLNDVFLSRYPEIKSGAIVSGDSFVSDAELRDILKNEFGAMSCDMESAAIAYICSQSGTPFLALRRISDDAGEDATVSYRDMNVLRESCLLDIIFEALPDIAKAL